MENQIKPVVGATSTAPQIIQPKDQQAMVKVWNEDLDRLTKSQNFFLSPTERNFATSIIYGLVDKCTKDKIDVRQLNMTNFLEQVKHFGKMQLSLQEKELYIDIRNDGDTKMKNVTIMRQYQAIQKIMTRYCTKKIVRFVDGIVCNGDAFQTTTDFETGLTKIVKHIKNENIDRGNLNNIQKAYAIAYVSELGKIVPYAKVVEKNRIMTAYNCSPSTKKTVWNNHTERMVIKTAYWCLYNDVMKPFVEIPSDLQESFAKTDDDMDFENEQAQTDVVSDEVYDIPTNDFEKTETVVEEEQPQDVAGDFISYLDEQDAAQAKETVSQTSAKCSVCGKEISEKVASFSMDKFGKPLCYTCQREQ